MTTVLSTIQSVIKQSNWGEETRVYLGKKGIRGGDIVKGRKINVICYQKTYLNSAWTPSEYHLPKNKTNPYNFLLTSLTSCKFLNKNTCCWSTNNLLCADTQVFCLSVKNNDCCPVSLLTLVKFSMITPTHRFIMKNEPKKIKRTK